MHTLRDFFSPDVELVLPIITPISQLKIEGTIRQHTDHVLGWRSFDIFFDYIACLLSDAHLSVMV